MHRKTIIFIALIAFSCTSLFGQKYVISLVHGDQNSPEGVHEHLYENWDQVDFAENQADSHGHLCDCECHSCFINVDGDEVRVYSFKSLNELPTTNLLISELDLSLADFRPVKSIIPSDVNWLFDFIARIERPPTFQLS